VLSFFEHLYNRKLAWFISIRAMPGPVNGEKEIEVGFTSPHVPNHRAIKNEINIAMEQGRKKEGGIQSFGNWHAILMTAAVDISVRMDGRE